MTYFSTLNKDKVLHITFIFCLHLIVYFNSTTYEHVGEHLETCSDCILWVDTSVKVDKDGGTTKARNLYLFSEFTDPTVPHSELCYIL